MNRKPAGLTSLLFLAVTTFTHAQSGQWAWLGGPPGTNEGIPTYGTLGVPSTKNIPALREGSGTWTDSKGNLWLFGGYGSDSVYNYGYLDDLWEYSPGNATWTWVGGSNLNGPNYGQPGVYGTLGVASPSNIPGGRAPAAIWQDSKGNVWMFGGGGMDSTDTFNGDGSLNDLWMYNPTTNEWTWMGGGTTVPHFNGGQPGVYGTLGVASSSNQPGGRVDSASWTDAQGNFWLFGGSGDDVNGNIGELNDIWMYNPHTNEWTWEGGSTTVAGAITVAGGQGAFAAGNMPSGRNGAASWTDSQGNFWLFGGSGSSGVYEDMWEFNPTTKQWAWLTGPTTSSTAASGDYGTQGTPSGSNLPPGREFGATWIDAAGNLWLFGGLGYDSTGNQNIFNDQWEYSTATNQWTWVNGSNSVASGGDYGPQGAPSASSMPGARYAPDFWKDTSGNFWLFGGLTPVVSEGNGFYSGYGFYSDLWEYFTPSAASSGPQLSISPFGLQFAVVAGEVSAAQQITLRNPGTASLSISGITLGGTGAAAYQQTNTCGASLAAGASCTISVTFSPTASQSYPATLSIASNAPGSPQAVTLTGTGNIPTSTTIFASATALTTGSSLNLAATVASTVGNTIPTGTVTFNEDGSTIGTGTLSGTGVATYTVTSLTLGSHSFTATYPGDTLHGSSASGSVTVTGAASVQISAPQWEWVAGGQTATFITAAPPVYGTLGTPSPSNYPGDVAGGTTWTDAHGNLWLFYGENAENDLWKYNIALGQWTWVSGINLYDTSPSLAGVYGTLGTPAAGNTPGGRDDNVSWIDAKGDLWIFGGSGADSNGVFAPLNDLWMFNPATSLWTWEGGSSTAVSAGLGPTGVYGTKGVASPTNVPGGRTQAMSWTDKSGNFWLFGGYGSDSTGTLADLNDLWEFSPTTGEWTWMGGASVVNGLGVYGTEGVPAAGNVPGSRTGGTTWVDNSGNLWLFGGTGYTNNVYGTGFLNDLWKYDLSTNQWTWVSGSNLANAAGVYGTQGLSNSGNMPDGRQNAGGWVDSSGNLWLFGGADQYSSTTYLLSDFLNDLWVYLPSSNSWAWVAGSNTGNQPGVYGTQGTPSASNIPAGRYAPLTWTDANGNFWLMGGANNELNTTFSDFDDFWTTGSAPATPSGPLASLAPGSLAFSSTLGQTTAQQSVTLSNGGSSALSIAGISIVGTGASAFAETTTCGSTLAVGSTCSISITFTPTAPISYSAEVLVSDDAANSPQSVGLGGEGFVPALPATTTTLGVTASTITVGASETITATVKETSGNATPTGTVTFYDGNATLGTGTLNGSGVATLTTSSLTLGSNSLTATYNGDASNSGSTSPAVNVTVNAAGGGSNLTSPVWTWEGGSQGKVATPPTFGTQGVPSSSNFPGSQSEATTWTDASGNLWLFGGSQSDSSGTYGTGNDLWRYNPSTSQWTWMGGGTIDATGVAEGSYGTLGTAAAGNLPPGRLGGIGWVDANGNFWLFGGTAFADISGHYENQYYNDLWKYSTATNQWTWMGGNSTPNVSGFASGVFGTKGTPSTANIPSGRYGSVSWTDQNGNLWLMGGSGVDSTGITAMLNDLWRYSPSSGQWTWMTGNSVVGINNGLSGTTSGVYGSQGVASTGNTPGGRFQGESWIDASGNFWLFGGWGSDSTGTTGLLNDLWEYSPSANTWTWVGGGATLPTTTSGLFEAPAGVYGTQGTPSASNVPGGRYVGAAWADASGNFWLFGGVGADSTDTDGLLNDVWVYSPTSNQWTWMGGSTTVNATAVYGTEGVAGASNTPGSRNMMLYWTDATHNLWLFGGLGGSYQPGDPTGFTYYDLWTTGSAGATSPRAATPTFNVPGSTYNSAQSVNISDTTPNATIYYTTDGTTPTTSSTVYSGTAITVSSTETIEAIATASGYTQSATATATYTISAAQAATPTFNPPAGNYSSAQSVTLSDTTPNATIYYTTDGTTPTTNSTVYNGAAIPVSSTETINAIAVASGDTASAVATAGYTITLTTQAEDWTWMGGPNVIGSSTVAPGNYGTLGVSASTNLPLGRSDPETWTDKSGNFWMMGGSTISESLGVVELNDLWEYSPTTLEWTWQGGANSVPAGTDGAGDTFGPQGTPSAQSVPGARFGSFTWSDASGNLWLYGGFGVDPGYLLTTESPIESLYSFWKYTPSSGQWTWIAGTDYGVPADVVNSVPTYGVMGTPSSANFPGARSGGSTWTDSAGNLWMFGGDVVNMESFTVTNGFGETAIDGNDLWKFDPTSQQWTWEAGSEVTTSAAGNPNCTPGVSGTLGQAAPGITPSGRGGSSSWIDSAGNLWLFGGQGCGSFNINAANNDTWGALNDLWKFNTTTNQWTWEAGGTDADQHGVYGTLGTPSAGNTPGERSNAYAWTDSSGKFWLFGGSGYDSNGNYGSFDDLWMFDPSTNEWTWEGGATTDSGSAGLPGVYGTLGVGAAGNIPGARRGGGAWTDASGNLWLFGGGGEDASGTLGDLNDLWEYGSGALVTPQAATPTFNVPGGNYSTAQSVTLSDTTPNATIYYTTDGNPPTTNSTVYSGAAIPVASTETIEAIATASGYTQSATATATYTITAQAKTTPTVTVSPSPASITTAQALSVTITVSGTPTPTGSVTLTSGTYTSGSGTLSNGSVTISIAAGALAIGTDTLTATYTPDANSSSTFTAATGANTVAVTAAVVTAPVASLTPAGPLTFTAVSGSTSAAQMATLNNTGNAALSITGITITGTNAGSFAETNTCGSSLAAGSNCTISITFSPASDVSLTATLSVADNAGGSPQTITLNGTGTASTAPAVTFALSSLTSTGTVTDATAATYQLTVTPQNGSFTSPISLTVSGVPTGYMAAFNPASVTPGSSPATATLTISKSPMAMLERTLSITAPALALIGFFLVPWTRRRRFMALVLFAGAAIGTLTCTGCGGGFGLPTTTYNVSITASGGGTSQTTTVQLTVRQ